MHRLSKEYATAHRIIFTGQKSSKVLLDDIDDSQLKYVLENWISGHMDLSMRLMNILRKETSESQQLVNNLFKSRDNMTGSIRPSDGTFSSFNLASHWRRNEGLNGERDDLYLAMMIARGRSCNLGHNRMEKVHTLHKTAIADLIALGKFRKNGTIGKCNNTIHALFNRVRRICPEFQEHPIMMIRYLQVTEISFVYWWMQIIYPFVKEHHDALIIGVSVALLAKLELHTSFLFLIKENFEKTQKE